jgi:hypothetical protein
MSLELSALSKERLEKMLAAGRVVEECHRVLSKVGDNIVGDLLKGCGPFYQMNHYPDGDVYDHDTHSQYYYHAHRRGEHGHFHLFLRPKGMPLGISPCKVDDYVTPQDDNDALSHLIAISMDAYGCVQSLFTTNRWVTAEYWYDCEDVIKMLDYFEIDHASPSWPVNQWISAIVELFYPQICDLLRARDQAIKTWQAEHPDDNVFENRKLEITSELSCDAFKQIKSIEEALNKIS